MVSMESFFLSYGWVVIIGAFALCYCFLFPTAAACVTDWRAERRRPILEAEARVLEANRSFIVNGVPRQRTSEIPVITAHELNSTSSTHRGEAKDGYESSSDSDSSLDLEHGVRRGKWERKEIERKEDRDRARDDLVEARRVASSLQITAPPYPVAAAPDDASPSIPPPRVEVLSSFVVEEAVESNSSAGQRLRNARFLRNV